ncbi:MAG: hypothetical protein COA47_16395, partial [Robiginitomaculum sp.]
MRVKTMRQKPDNLRGVSLLEMLIVLAIMG